MHLVCGSGGATVSSLELLGGFGYIGCMCMGVELLFD